MKKYYMKYKPLTGLGAPVKTKWFETIEERFKFYMSGVQVVGFGQRMDHCGITDNLRGLEAGAAHLTRGEDGSDMKKIEEGSLGGGIYFDGTMFFCDMRILRPRAGRYGQGR